LPPCLSIGIAPWGRRSRFTALPGNSLSYCPDNGLALTLREALISHDLVQQFLRDVGLRLRLLAQVHVEHLLDRAEPVPRLAPVVFPVADGAD